MNIDPYLNKHWVNGDYDCWDLVRDVYAKQYNIELPIVPIDASNIELVSDAISHSEHRLLFRSIENPLEGCVVEMQRKHRQPNKTLARHVGIFINPNYVLHNSGVVRCLTVSRILVDWSIIGYFLHVSDSRISQCVKP